jgi:hypothetical protein
MVALPWILTLTLTLVLIGTAYGGAAFGRRQGVAEPLHDGFSYLHGTAALAHAVGAAVEENPYPAGYCFHAKHAGSGGSEGLVFGRDGRFSRRSASGGGHWRWSKSFLSGKRMLQLDWSGGGAPMKLLPQQLLPTTMAATVAAGTGGVGVAHTGFGNDALTLSAPTPDDSGGGGGGAVKSVVGRSEDVAVVVVADKRFGTTLPALRSVSCWAAARGYDFIVLDPAVLGPCAHHTNLFFAKHCAVAVLIAWRAPGSLLLVLDADVAVARPDATLEEFMAAIGLGAQARAAWGQAAGGGGGGEVVDVVHYERFHSNEVSAGNYIVRATPWAAAYLHGWASMERELRRGGRGGMHNNDNGALHLHLLKVLGLNWQRCDPLWGRKARDELRAYDRFVNCAKRELGRVRRWPHVLLLHRGQGFAADHSAFGARSADGSGGDGALWVPDLGSSVPTPFLLHGLTDAKHFAAIAKQAQPCALLAGCPVLTVALVEDERAARAAVLRSDAAKTKARPGAFDQVGSLIGKCWPRCKQLTAEQVARRVLAAAQAGNAKHRRGREEV